MLATTVRGETVCCRTCSERRYSAFVRARSAMIPKFVTAETTQRPTARIAAMRAGHERRRRKTQNTAPPATSVSGQKTDAISQSATCHQVNSREMSLTPLPFRRRGKNSGGGLRKAAAKDYRMFYSLDALAPQNLFAGYRARIYHGNAITFAVVEIEPNAPLPSHHHHNEQVGLMVSGELTFNIDGERRPCLPVKVG
jgi:mannose-6-phosphate isomerase-like protein (cupin superfamily)